MTTGRRCVLIAGADGSQSLQAVILDPVLPQVGLDLYPTQGLSVDNLELISAATLVLIDAQAGWTTQAGQAVGTSQALNIPFLALMTPTQDDEPWGVRSVNRLETQADYANDQWIAATRQRLQEQIGTLLDVRASRTSVRSATGDAHLNDRTGSPDFDLPSAERWLTDLWLDGLSTEVIRQELLRAGVPRAWIDLRLRRRPGW